MKITESTMAILKNFATINPSIQFRKGNVIKTRLQSKDLMGTAILDDEFPEDFAILDLPRFLGAIALFSGDVELEFKGDNAVRISSATNSVRYSFTDPQLVALNVVTDYDKKLPIPPSIAKFSIKWEDLSKVKQAASVLSVPNITVVGSNGKLQLVAQDAKMESSDRFSLDIGECSTDFTANFKIETLKLIPDNYEVNITERIVAEFTGSKVIYHVVTEVKQ